MALFHQLFVNFIRVMKLSVYHEKNKQRRNYRHIYITHKIANGRETEP